MSKLLSIIQLHWKILTIVTLVAITTLSLWPLPNLPEVPGTDKSHHLFAYAILIFPVALRKPARWKRIGLFFVGYSGIIELAQPYVNRYGEWLDFVANLAGLICGLLVAELSVYAFSLKSGKKQ